MRHKRLFLIQICKFSLVLSLTESPEIGAYPCMFICNVKLQSCRNIFDSYSEIVVTIIIAKPYQMRIIIFLLFGINITMT